MSVRLNVFSFANGVPETCLGQPHDLAKGPLRSPSASSRSLAGSRKWPSGNPGHAIEFTGQGSLMVSGLSAQTEELCVVPQPQSP